MNIEFYRVEDDRQEGPYNFGVGMGALFNDSTVHPVPGDDGIEPLYSWDPEKNRSSWLFGFQSVDQLREWFSPEMLEYLSTQKRKEWDSDRGGYRITGPYDFRVSMYVVPEESIVHGGRQSIADPARMTHIGTIRLQEVYA